MPSQAWAMLGILVVMFALLIWDRLPAWLVFMATLTAAMTLKLASAEALLKGFSNTGVFTVAALFPVAAGMYATGAISLLSQRMIGLPKSLGAAQIKILPPVALGSAFLNNTPIVAMMIPVVRDLARNTGLAGSKLFMGLSFASILGGTMTLIGTSVNLIIAGLAADAMASGNLTGMKPLTVFTPIWVGLPATVAGLLFMMLIGTRLLPGDSQQVSADSVKRIFRVELRVQPQSNLDGKTLEAAGFANPVGYRLLSVTRNGAEVEISSTLKLSGGDVLAFAAPAGVLSGLWVTIGLVPAHSSQTSTPRHRNHLVEVVVSPKSPAVGRLISELPAPDTQISASLVGASHDGHAPEVPLGDYRVQAGDGGILEVDDSFFYENRLETDFILTKVIEGVRVQRVDRAWTAAVITLVMVAAAALGVTSMLNAALLATVAMLLSGCLSVERVWRSLDWKTLVVLGAAVGLESAVTGSGLSLKIADLCTKIGGDNPTVALAVILAGTLIMTNVITNAAAAAFMFPVALSMSQRLHVSFLPFVVILMVGASCAFINPAGFQTNLMVQEPGGYTFMDFAKVGLPLTILVGIVVIIVAPLAYGF
ncbi:MAG TPA: SLC13 family permease [Terriglobales bacterium]|nr:SLC13 family permease [Terriglobales bacterium]